LRLKEASVEKSMVDGWIFLTFATRSANRFFRILQEHWGSNRGVARIVLRVQVKATWRMGCLEGWPLHIGQRSGDGCCTSQGTFLIIFLKRRDLVHIAYSVFLQKLYTCDQSLGV